MTLAILKPSKRTIIVLATAAGVIFCISAFTYYGFSQRLNKATADCQKKQQQVIDNEKIASRLKDAEASFLQAQNDLGFLETSVSSKDYVPTMLKQLEALGTSLNLRVISVRPQPAPAPPPVKRTSEEGGNGSSGGNAPVQKIEKKPYDELPIDIEVEGTYWNARNFINRLTEFPKIVAVTEVEISPSDTMAVMKGSPKLLVKMRIQAYVFPVDPAAEPAPAHETPAPATSAMGEGRSNREG